MTITQTEIEGLVILEPRIFNDDRGTFFESYNEREFKAKVADINFVQDNVSVSKKEVIRGLHFQDQPYDQGKLVRVSFGKVLDVVVDIRPNSKTFSKVFTIELSSENNKMLWIPPGFAHGFECLTSDVVFTYKVSKYYNQASEKGILFNDPELNIKWQTNNPIVSGKDLELPLMKVLFRRI